jgi:hypothetical protein
MIGGSLRSEPWRCVALALLFAACRGEGAGSSAAIRRHSPAPSPSAAPQVSLPEILDYARRAGAAYKDETAIRAVVAPGSILAVADLPGVDVRAFVEVDEASGVQWVAVRGTANFKNVAEDADYTKVLVPDLGIPVHAGFVQDARAVWSFAQPRLRPGLETRLTGHSLGGALALLLAMRLSVDGQPLGRVITFGQPKVTTEEGVVRFRGLPLLRVVNHDDPVPDLPWETAGAVRGGLYRHLGQELRLTDRGSFELLTEHKAERYLVTSFLSHLGRENPLEHEIVRYLRKIEAILEPAGPPSGGRS